jgi:esterase/lipase
MKNENKKIYKSIKVNNLKISYIFKERKKTGPKISVVFLSGYKSDMKGTKAKFIDKLSNDYGFEYLRFNYSGHGNSEGKIEEQTISSWLKESLFLIKKNTHFPLILIGSSMGGWISLLIAIKFKSKIKGIIGIAVAPDFTKKLINKMSPKEKKMYLKNKFIRVASEYAESEYTFTSTFIEDAKKNYILKNQTYLPSKLSLLYGTTDNAVTLNDQLKILSYFKFQEAKLIISKESDHRMSSKKDLTLLKRELEQMIRDNI